MKLTTTHSTPWWKNGVIYQIYPKSFQASEGKSQGDIAGIIKRLDYLKTLGVDAIWLTPIYISPQIDNGYDVADYCQIDPIYGSMSEFEQLVAQSHQRGIRIMMDMVFNHTSTEHAWFKAACDKNSPYRQYYIWRDKPLNSFLPNNWQAKFGGNAWQWHEQSEQFYLHLFTTQQADLNWEHKPVRESLKEVCRFWANKGVDALRLDVINLVSKQQDFPDDDQGDGRRFYTDGPRIHEFLQELSQEVFQPLNLATVGEMSSTTLDSCQKYASLDGNELSMTFNFHHLKVDYPNGEKWTLAKPDFIELKRLFNQWQQGMYNKAWNALFWCNHDQPRIVSRFGNDKKYHNASAKMLAIVLHGMQGTPYIYQGEEIGMVNPNFTAIDNYRDIESLNFYQTSLAKNNSKEQTMTILAQKSRDNSRTPMQWDDSENAGFSTVTPWINTANNYREINCQHALHDKTSIFYCYQKLIDLRKQYDVFTSGRYEDLLPDSADLWCYSRVNDNDTLLVIANLTEDFKSYSLPNQFIKRGWKLILANYDDLLADDPFLHNVLKLRPYETLMLITNQAVEQ